MVRCCLLVLLALIQNVAMAEAENWPAWRGPRGDGTSLEADIPTQWGPQTNVCWRTAIPGKGHSSPIVWEDRIFLTSCRESEAKRVLLCLRRSDGAILWERVVAEARLEAKHGLNSYASSTPATDGQHIWVSFLTYPDMLVVCYDLNGKEIWRRSPGRFYSKHGFCSPPILYKDLVILNGDQDAEAWIVALDKATGAERWRTDRPNRTRSYCPPLIAKAAGREQLVLSGSKCVASYDPETGKQLWIVQGPTEQFVASVVYGEGLLFLTAGYPEYHIMAIRPDGNHDVTQTHIAWRDTRGAGYVPSPIAQGPYFFLVNDNGLASCLEAKNGRRAWVERLGKHHSASPVAAGGLIYFVDDAGTTFVIKAAPQFALVAKNALNEECYASPAISQGQLFIRTTQHLYCIGKPRTSGQRAAKAS